MSKKARSRWSGCAPWASSKAIGSASAERWSTTTDLLVIRYGFFFLFLLSHLYAHHVVGVL